MAAHGNTSFLSHPVPHYRFGHRQEFGLLRNRPDASLPLRARWIAQTRRRLSAANDWRNPNGILDQETGKRAVHRRILRRLREAPDGTRVYMRVGDVFRDADVVSIDELRAAREAARVRDDDDEGEYPRQ